MQRVIAKVAGEAAFYAGVAFFVVLCHVSRSTGW